MRMKQLDCVRYAHTDLDKLMIILQAGVKEFIYIDNVNIWYNAHSEMWNGSIYGDVRDEN